MWRIPFWMYLTQRNGKGPVKYIGLTVLEWIILVLLISIVIGFIL